MGLRLRVVSGFRVSVSIRVRSLGGIVGPRFQGLRDGSEGGVRVQRLTDFRVLGPGQGLGLLETAPTLG